MRLFGLNKIVSTIIVIIAVVLLLSFISLFFPKVTEPSNTIVYYVTYPFQTLGNSIKGRFDRGGLSAEEAAALRAEIATLRTDLAAAQREARENAIYREENEQYRGLLALKQAYRQLDIEAAYVTGWQEGSYAAVFTIRKGSKDGLVKNMPVITDEGLVGYLSFVSYEYSEVTTLIDTTSVVGAHLFRTGDIAVCEGDFELMKDGNLKLSYLAKTTEVQPGDIVETSGSGEIYPKGLVIGTVVEILPEEHGLSNYAVIEPTVNLKKLSQVFVVTGFEVVD